jgi:hypothetical protein
MGGRSSRWRTSARRSSCPRRTRTEVAEAADGATLTHDELPLEDYDHMTLTALRSRIRSLDAAQLVQLREYEQAHANRLPVVKAFDTRLAKLAKGQRGPAARHRRRRPPYSRSRRAAGGCSTPQPCRRRRVDRWPSRAQRSSRSSAHRGPAHRRVGRPARPRLGRGADHRAVAAPRRGDGLHHPARPGRRRLAAAHLRARRLRRGGPAAAGRSARRRLGPSRTSTSTAARSR